MLIDDLIEELYELKRAYGNREVKLYTQRGSSRLWKEYDIEKIYFDEYGRVFIAGKKKTSGIADEDLKMNVKMNEETKKNLVGHYEYLNILLNESSEEVEKIINLLKDPNTSDFEIRENIAAFLEGRMDSLKEHIEWLNYCPAP